MSVCVTGWVKQAAVAYLECVSSFNTLFPEENVFWNWEQPTLIREKAMAPHSSTLAWNIPWMEEPGRLQSMGSLGVRHDWADFTFTFHFHALEKEMATHSSILAWRIPGTGEPGGLPSVGSHRVRHDWSDLAAATTLIREENGNLLQYSCLENSMDRRAW